MILRYQQKSLILLGGVPGSGKSTLLSKFDWEDDVDIISADQCRGQVQMMYGEPYDAYIEERIPEAREDFFRAMDSAASNGKSIIAEASYLTSHARHEMIMWAIEHWYTPHLIVIYASLSDVREAQNSRKRRVPEDVLLRHWKNWERLADQLDDSVYDPGLETAIMLARSEVDCLDSIRFNNYA